MSASSRKKKAKFVPSFDGEIKGWTVNFLTKHAWRVARTMEFNDCVQDAYEVFVHTAASYPEVDNPRHFMSLYQTTWENHFTDLARRETRKREREVDLSAKEAHAITSRMVGELRNEGELRTAMRQAPREVRMVLELMLRAPQEIVEIALAPRDDGRFKRANGCERINAMLGLPSHQDTIGNVYRYFAA